MFILIIIINHQLNTVTYGWQRFTLHLVFLTPSFLGPLSQVNGCVGSSQPPKYGKHQPILTYTQHSCMNLTRSYFLLVGCNTAFIRLSRRYLAPITQYKLKTTPTFFIFELQIVTFSTFTNRNFHRSVQTGSLLTSAPTTKIRSVFAPTRLKRYQIFYHF